MLGADATSVVISLPRRAVPRRSTRLQPDATATGDDARDPTMPGLGKRGYCSSDEDLDEESVFSSDEEDAPRRTRRRGVFDDTPPGRIGSAVLDAFPPLTVRAALPCFRGPVESPPKGGESVSDDPVMAEAADARLTQRGGNDAAPPAQDAPTEEQSGAAGTAAAEVVAAAEGTESAAAAEGAAAGEEDPTIRAAPARTCQ